MTNEDLIILLRQLYKQAEELKEKIEILEGDIQSIIHQIP